MNKHINKQLLIVLVFMGLLFGGAAQAERVAVMGIGAGKTCRMIIGGEKDAGYYTAIQWAEGGATLLEAALASSDEGQKTGWKPLADLAPNAPWATDFVDELKRQCRQSPNQDLSDAVVNAYLSLHEQYKIAASQK